MHSSLPPHLSYSASPSGHISIVDRTSCRPSVSLSLCGSPDATRVTGDGNPLVTSCIARCTIADCPASSLLLSLCPSSRRTHYALHSLLKVRCVQLIGSHCPFSCGPASSPSSCIPPRCRCRFCFQFISDEPHTRVREDHATSTTADRGRIAASSHDALVTHYQRTVSCFHPPHANYTPQSVDTIDARWLFFSHPEVRLPHQ
jgi:hypothetical protein